MRAAEDYFADIEEPKIDKELRDLARELITRKVSPFDPSRYTDHYADALKDLIEEKRKGHAIISSPEEEPAKPQSNVIDPHGSAQKERRRRARAQGVDFRQAASKTKLKVAAAAAPRTKRKTAPAKAGKPRR